MSSRWCPRAAVPPPIVFPQGSNVSKCELRMLLLIPDDGGHLGVGSTTLNALVFGSVLGAPVLGTGS